MTETFTASNGCVLVMRSNGFTASSIDGVEVILALREFFQHQRDKELGRWRWPEDPALVVYERVRSKIVGVLHEPTGQLLSLTRGEYPRETKGFAGAANAYFAAHPEPKPWHDAKHNELWELRMRDCGPEVYRCAQESTCADSLAFRPVNNPERVWFSPWSRVIESARRIWPEEGK